VPVAEEMTVLQKLCVSNIKRFAEKSKYKFTLVTNKDYISYFKDNH
jgi:hypothetical protein